MPRNPSPASPRTTVFIDETIIQHYALARGSTRGAACAALFQEARKGRRRLWTSDGIILVCTERPRDDLTPAQCRRLADATNLLVKQQIITDVDSHWHADQVLQRAIRLSGDDPPNAFFDACYHAAMVLEQGQRRVMSYDTMYDLIPAIDRIEPRPPVA